MAMTLDVDDISIDNKNFYNNNIDKSTINIFLSKLHLTKFDFFDHKKVDLNISEPLKICDECHADIYKSHYTCTGCCMSYDLCENCYTDDIIIKHKNFNPIVKSSSIYRGDDLPESHETCSTCKKDAIHYICRECYGNFNKCIDDCCHLDIHISDNDGIIKMDTGRKIIYCHKKKVHKFKKINVEYDVENSYQYFICILNKLDNDTFCYIIRKNNYNKSNLDIKYILKVYSKGNVIIEKEILTYNPYFGIRILNLNYNLDDKIVHIVYQEKHCECEMFVQATDTSHATFIKEGEECGNLIKFIKDGNIQKNY